MVERNQYEPNLKPITQADVQDEAENQAADNQPLNYTDVMRASNEGTLRRDVASVTERTEVSDVKDPDIQKAFSLVDNAKEAAMLLSILESKQPDNTPIQMMGADGRPFSVTMGQMKQKLVEDLSKNSDFKAFNDPAQLRDFVGKTTQDALALSQQTREKYEAKSRETDVNVNARNELAKQLGFPGITREVPDGKGGKTTVTSYDITQKDVDARLASATDAGQKANLEKLKGLLTNYDSIQKERNALSSVDVNAAQLMMGGFTHKAGEQTLEGMPASRQEVMRAYEIMNKAGRGNPQLEQTPQFQLVKEQSGAMYADIQLQRSKDAVLALQAADKLRTDGKPTEAQAKYEEALKKVKEVDMATITTQWQSQMKEFNTTQEKLKALGDPPSNPQEAQRLTVELQQRQQIGLQLEQIIQVGKEVKTEYARFLNEQGKPGEALPLLTSVASGTPQELLAGDQTFNEQMEKAQSMGSITSGDAEKHRVLYEQAMASKDWSTAEKELAVLKAASTKASQEGIQGAKDRLAVMDKRQTEIKTEMEELKKNTTLSDEAKTLRQQQLEAETKGYDVLRKGLEEGIPAAEKAAQEHAHQMRYMEGIIAYSKDDKETANKIFKELEAEAPEIASNKDYQLNELLEDTRHKNWLERHWDTIVNVVKVGAVIGAIVAATVITAPIGGVGGVAAAAVIGGGLGAAGVFGAGAAGHFGAQALGYKSTDNYNNWRPLEDLKTGAIQGGLGAGIGKIFAIGGTAGLGNSMVARGTTMAAEGRTFAGAALQYGGRAVTTGGEILTNATKFPNALKIGATYGVGSETINAVQGKGFHIEDAALKTIGMTGGLYGAGKFGGLASLKGSAVYGAAMTGQETTSDLVHGREINPMAKVGSFAENMTTAFLWGSASNMNIAAQEGRFAIRPINPEGTPQGFNMATVRNFPGAMKDGFLSSGRLVFGDGLGIAGKSKYVAGAAGVGLVGWQTFQADSAYNNSRTAKEWDTEDNMTRMGMNQKMEILSRPIRRPVVKQPGQP